MSKILLSVFLIVLISYSCKPKNVTYEHATKWYSDCHTHPKLHQGDMYALDIEIDERLCYEECADKYDCEYEQSIENSRRQYFKGIESCSDSLRACRFECTEKGHPIKDIAEHIEGGYYSDGSYYAICESLYKNIHPTRDKYKKTQWQKDRDDCVQLTYENLKPSFWEQIDTNSGGLKFHKRAKKNYRACLNERGYSINLEDSYP